MATLSIRLSDEIEDRLEREAQLAGANRSEVARTAIVDYLGRMSRQRFMAEVIEEARQLKGDPEALRIAEEALPFDNEALDLAESGTAEDLPAGAEEPWWR